MRLKSSSGIGAAVAPDQAFGAADAGAVDQDARRAVALARRVQGLLHAGGVGDVAAAGDAADLHRPAPLPLPG
jgi:hypothetical protein